MFNCFGCIYTAARSLKHTVMYIVTTLYFDKHEAEKPDVQKEEKLKHITKCFPSTYYSMIDKYTSSTFGMSS